MRDYIGIAQQYIEDVLAGSIPACKWVRLACRRQRDDLANGVPGFHFSDAHAARVCLFAEMLPHIKGELAGQKLHLEPWQIFILTTVFGWVNSAGHRRFRRVYIEVPRGNGKSALSSAVALYGLCADHEQGAEVYTFATTRDQARIVFNTSKEMMRRSPDVARYFNATVQANSVAVLSTSSSLEPKSSEGSTLDGLNTHLAIIDELHAHKTREVYDVVETSIGKRTQPLLWVITTAGSDRAGVCYEVRGFVCKVLERIAQDEQQFGIIYSIDRDDDWRTEAALRKANPNYGVSVRPDIVKALQEKAITVASAANNFQTKHLDVWTSADESWMNMPKWDALADRTLDPADFEDGSECCIGLDLASKKDICAKVKLFRREIGGKLHYYVFGDYFLPEETIETAKNSQYQGWVNLQQLHATPGASTDFELVSDSIRDDLARFNVVAVCYDPWQATQLATSLSNEGAPMLEVRQTVQNLSEPMKTLEALVLDGRIHHDGNPCLTWMISNVVAHTDAKENIYPRKQRAEEKIDGAVALITALSRFIGSEQVERAPSFDDFINNMAVI